MMEWRVHTKVGVKGCSGTLGDLVRALPYVLSDGKSLPPYAVCRSLFLRGQVGGGQGDMVSWDPFDLTESDYRQLSAGPELSAVDLPVELKREINSVEDWMVFLMSPDDTELAMNLVRLDKESRACFSQYEEKSRVGASDEAARFLDKHLKANQKFTEMLKKTSL
jgi:hypothetical protein